MENKDGQDSPTKQALSTTAPPLNSNVAETPLDPSSSTASLPLAPSSSAPPTVDLLSGSSLSSAAASFTVTPTPDVDLALRLAFPGVNTSLGSTVVPQPSGLNLPAAASPSQGQGASSSSRNVRRKPRSVPRKPRPINFPMTRINIGNWTQTAANSWDLVAKCHFGKQQFVWEIISSVETEAGLRRQVKKMEIDWRSVLSFKAEHDCFQIELSRPPRFRIENNDYKEIGAWKDIDHFAEDHPSSTCRRHALFFDPEVLKTNYDKIVENVFWSSIKNVQFPTLPSLLFSGDGPQDNLEAVGEKRKFDQIS